MARTTVDDCLDEKTGHFDLAYAVPQRAREIMRTGDSKVTPYGDKPIVVALREVADAKSEAAAANPADSTTSSE